MERFKLEIKLGNAAMLEGYDIANALADVQDKLREGWDHSNIMDLNGNTVGSWEIA